MPYRERRRRTMNKLVLSLALLITAPAFAQISQDDPLRTETVAGGPRHKHPKLSTHVADLRRAGSHRTQPPPPGERIEAPPRLDVKTLPKFVPDPVRPGQVRLSTH